MAARANRRQQQLPGTNAGIPALEQIGFELEAVRSKRMDLTKQELQIQERGIQTMEKEGLETYHYGGVVLILTAEKKLKVRKDKTKADKSPKQ